MMADFTPIRAVGCMTGTSMDGVDVAEITTDGEAVIEIGQTAFRPFASAERQILRAALGKWPGETGVAEAARVIEAAHRDVLANVRDHDVIGFHGQTLAHDPAGGRTHQCGDPVGLFAQVPVVWDFRQADMGAGGVGAPLAPFYHHALARRAGLDKPVAFLNLGGVSNVSFVNPANSRPEATDAILAFDCGPANALLDDFMSLRMGAALDENGQLAAQGQVVQSALEAALAHPYFAQPAPKALDRDTFRSVMDVVAPLSDADGAATLTAFSIAAVAKAEALFPEPVTRWFVCGGGRHNGTMMAGLARSLTGQVQPVEALGVDGDSLEAQAFAWLAVRRLRGLPISAPGTTGCRAPTVGGRICDPIREASFSGG